MRSGVEQHALSLHNWLSAPRWMLYTCNMFNTSCMPVNFTSKFYLNEKRYNQIFHLLVKLMIPFYLKNV